MHDDKWAILIEKYLAGKCTPAEKLLVEQYYSAMDENLPEFYNNDGEKIAQSAKESLKVVESKIALLNKKSDTAVSPKGAIIRYLKPLSIAASLLLLVSISIIIYQKINASQKVVFKQVTALTGHTLHIILADSSSVWLNAGSSLKYTGNLTTATRDVYLSGEAFFDVKHNVARPFIVHTAKLTTTVLGTAFSVAAYKNAGSNAVTVIRGKVQVAAGGRVLGLITPGKQITYLPATGQSNLSVVDAEALMSWKDGKLQFSDQTLQDISIRLSQWYGYTFRFDNNRLKTCRYTASFNNKIRLEGLLKVLKAISNTNYTINDKDKTVTFSGAGCKE
jgi:ferric-dicitrate binding protein FerR (iron transport regulator)